MSKKIIYIGIIFLAIVAQTTFFPIFFSRITPDVVLMLILAWTILDGFNNFFLWSILAGLFYDLASMSVIGTHIIVFLFVVYFVSFFSNRFQVGMKGLGVIIIALMIGLSTLVSNAVFVLVEITNVEKISIIGSIKFIVHIILEFVYNGILFVFVYAFLKKIKKTFFLGNQKAIIIKS